MIPSETRQLLQRYKAGEVDEADVLRLLCAAPIDDLGFAQVDAHRSLRQGFPEVIFAIGKTPGQVAAIAAKVMERGEVYRSRGQALDQAPWHHRRVVRRDE